jgi:hypothetical protein
MDTGLPRDLPGALMRWRRLDVPGREDARFDARPGGWRVQGRVEVQEAGIPARLRYEIECDEQWRTRSVAIAGEAGERRVTLSLHADGEGSWSMDGRAVPILEGAVDIDLGFTPSTNTLPIRRLNLAVGDSAPVTTAWLRFPELRLEPLDQTYTRVADRIYRYEAIVDGERFTARLHTDGVGIVTHYEGLWEPDTDKPDTDVPENEWAEEEPG